jgi:uncharacterized RDD family membrane protein YckC
MTDPTLPPLPTRTEIPGQRPADHPMRPDLPQYAGTPYALDVAHPPPRNLAPPRTEPDEAYAHWILRVAAVFIDWLLQVPFAIAQVIGLMIAFEGGGIALQEREGLGTWFVITVPQMTTETWIGLSITGVAGMSSSIFSVWNNLFRQGRRGASIGKQCMNLMVVSGTDGRPIGALMTFIRGWAHLLDLVTLGVGYLWPLWDRKRQTFADMAMNTVVLHLPPLPPRPAPQIPAQATAPPGW